ncbi:MULTISPECIES: ABC transporter substrate-binding protein [Nocardiaceae]|uniref:ABC transporter substrate-binding protein n=1 Tax=Nocardiaceae TaxID=85025 RepID=UPI000AC77CBF|nr:MULTISPECIES: ABC transporter substrate-binding protein [Rhodococcus]
MFNKAIVRATSAVAVLALAAGCSSNSGDEPQSTESWNYTTAFGNTVTTDAHPDTIVVDAYSAAALWDYGIRPDGVFGFGLADGSALGTAEADRMTVIGTDSVFDTEAAAALDPDVIIGYAKEAAPQSWTWWDASQAEQIAAVAPFLGVDVSLSIDESLEQYRSIAEALGADVDNPDIAADREDFEAAKQRVKDAVANKPGLTVMPLNVDTDGIYIGTENLVVLKLLRELGLTLAGPEADGPWSTVSWENVPQYPADIVLEYPASKPILADSAIYRSLPAVAGGQVLDWDDKRPNTYAEYADWLGQLADTIESANKLT